MSGKTAGRSSQLSSSEQRGELLLMTNHVSVDGRLSCPWPSQDEKTCPAPTEVLTVLYQDLQTHPKKIYLEKALPYSERDYSVIRQWSLPWRDPFHGAELHTGFFLGELAPEDPGAALGQWQRHAGEEVGHSRGSGGSRQGEGYGQAWGQVLPIGSLWFNKIRRHTCKYKVADVPPFPTCWEGQWSGGSPPEITSGKSVRSHRAGESEYGREEQSWDAGRLGPSCFHAQILCDNRKMAISPWAPEFCGCSQGPR